MISITIIVSLFFLSCFAREQQSPTTQVDKPEWTLVWSDEFNGVAGSHPDSTKWGYNTGDYGNGAYYTTNAQNCFQDGKGNLVIRAIADSVSHPPFSYTSAFIKTKGKFSQKYGRFEARIKFPRGEGIWPGFWLGGDNYLKWPQCGEVDIAEHRGKNPYTIQASVHGPAEPLGKNSIAYDYIEPLADDYHIYAVEWDENGFKFYLDNICYHSITSTQLLASNNWVFDQPYFILFDLFIGGSWAGNPNKDTVFPADMHVDYIRVYQKN